MKIKKILIAEDEKPMANAMENKLTSEGYVVTTVGDGAQVLVELKKKKYDLLLLDLIMPIMDGFTVLEQMKAKKIKTPVIVLSNLGQEEDQAKTKALGAKGYFIKSNISLSDIVEQIKKLKI